MEASLKEWNTSAKAAELGLERNQSDQGLLFRLGYALHRQGRELIAEGDIEKGIKLSRRAGNYLEKARKFGNQAERNYSLLYQIYRAIVLNLEAIEDIKSLPQTFSLWKEDCPADDVCETERLRLLRKYPQLPIG